MTCLEAIPTLEVVVVLTSTFLGGTFSCWVTIAEVLMIGEGETMVFFCSTTVVLGGVLCSTTATFLGCLVMRLVYPYCWVVVSTFLTGEARDYCI